MTSPMSPHADLDHSRLARVPHFGPASMYPFVPGPMDEEEGPNEADEGGHHILPHPSSNYFPNPNPNPNQVKCEAFGVPAATLDSTTNPPPPPPPSQPQPQPQPQTPSQTSFEAPYKTRIDALIHLLEDEVESVVRSSTKTPPLPPTSPLQPSHQSYDQQHNLFLPTTVVASSSQPATPQPHPEIEPQLQQRLDTSLNRRFKCTHAGCTKAFPTPKGLESHLSTHLDKPIEYACEVCDHTFNSKYRLKAHMAVHNDLPFKCDSIGCTFATSIEAKLIAHTKKHNRDRGREICDFPGCGRSFQKLANLKVHQLIHTGEREFRCETCGVAFTTKNRLKVHERDHTGERPYVCDHPGCGYAAKQKCALTSHLMRHMDAEEKKAWKEKNEKKLPCPECGKFYKSLESLNQHSWKAHKHGAELE
ncbi:hypothetical protein HDU99_002035 [Rhizoclosmatium hyalinum]|nr:hypothetical protein HDU99_002035 [Rhizoclosmatium hyalinum]